MNVLFCHDGPVKCDNEGRFYSVGFNDKLFERYAAVFDKVSIATRVDKEESHYTDLLRLSVDKYSVVEYPNYLSPRAIFANKKDSNKRLEEAIMQADALIIRLPSFLGSKCVRIAKKHKKPYLVELVGCPWDSLRNHGITGKILAPCMYFVTKRQIKQASDVLYVTDEFLQRRYPTKGRSVGCSDVFLDSIADSVLYKTKSKSEKLIIGTAGVLDVRYKGQEFVIESLVELKNEGIDAEYWLAGSGTGEYLREKATALGVSDMVKMCGVLDRTALNAFYDSVDVYAQPSLTEGMPRALIEAMSRGCYCIGTRVGGIPELIGSENCFKKACSSDVTKRIMSYYEDKENKNRTHCVRRSREFLPSFLEKKRNEFYSNFKKSVQKSDK